MDKFKTIDKIMNASIEELCEVEGIGEGLAQKIKTYFKELNLYKMPISYGQNFKFALSYPRKMRWICREI